MAKPAHSKPRHVRMCLITSLQRVVKVPLSSHFHADYRGTRDSKTVGPFAQPTGVIVLERLFELRAKRLLRREALGASGAEQSAHLPRTESICAENREYEDTPVRRTSSELQMIP